MAFAKRSKLLNAHDAGMEESAYLEAPKGCEIAGLHRQTLQPLNLNTRSVVLVNGTLKRQRDTQEFYDYDNYLLLAPTDISGSLDDYFGPEIKKSNKPRFGNVYINRLFSEASFAERFYVRILDAQMKSKGFYKQESGYNAKKDNIVFAVCKAGSLVENLMALEVWVEKKAVAQYGKPHGVAVTVKKHVKDFIGDNEVEQDVYYDFYASFTASKYTPHFKARVDGKEYKMTPEEFNKKCLDAKYDFTLSVNPWLMYSADKGITIGFNYTVEHVDVRRRKEVQQELINGM